MFKRLGSVIIAFALAACLSPVSAIADEGRLSVATSATQSSMSSVLSTQASSKYVTSKYKTNSSGRIVYFSAKAGGKTFKATPISSGDAQSCKLTVKTNGKTKVLAKGVMGGFATNGKTIFFAKRGKRVSELYPGSGATGLYSYRNAIYRMNVKTGKVKRMARGTDWGVFACDGTYLFCGCSRGSFNAGSLYSVRLGTGKVKRIATGVPGGNVYCAKGRVVVSDYAGGVGYTVYSFKGNGSSKKTLARDVWGYKVTKGKLVYIAGNVMANPQRCRAYQCSLTGKNRKALSKWTTDTSALYARYIG